MRDAAAQGKAGTYYSETPHDKTLPWIGVIITDKMVLQVGLASLLLDLDYGRLVVACLMLFSLGGLDHGIVIALCRTVSDHLG